MVSVFRKIMFVVSFLITIFIFLAGIYVGFLLDDYRIDDANTLLSNAQLDTDSFVIERDFFETFSVENCGLLTERMDLLGEELGEIGRTLARYDAKKIAYGEAYNQLKRKYFLLEIRAYTLRKQVFDLCPGETSDVILFFYNTENNQESLNQGYVLDAIVERRGNVTVFSFDKNFNETALSSFTDYYNITVTPSIVINFDNKFDGYVPEFVILQNLITYNESK